MGGGCIGAIKSLVNSRDLWLEYLVLYETLLVAILIYDSEAMLWKEKERSRIRALQMDNLRDLLGIRSMDRFLNVEVR